MQIWRCVVGGTVFLYWWVQRDRQRDLVNKDAQAGGRSPVSKQQSHNVTRWSLQLWQSRTMAWSPAAMDLSGQRESAGGPLKDGLDKMSIEKGFLRKIQVGDKEWTNDVVHGHETSLGGPCHGDQRRRPRDGVSQSRKRCQIGIFTGRLYGKG